MNTEIQLLLTDPNAAVCMAWREYFDGLPNAAESDWCGD